MKTLSTVIILTIIWFLIKTITVTEPVTKEIVLDSSKKTEFDAELLDFITPKLFSPVKKSTQSLPTHVFASVDPTLSKNTVATPKVKSQADKKRAALKKSRLEVRKNRHNGLNNANTNDLEILNSQTIEQEQIIEGLEKETNSNFNSRYAGLGIRNTKQQDTNSQPAPPAAVTINDVEEQEIAPEIALLDNWEIYTDSGGEIYTVADPEDDSNYVIQLVGDGEETGFQHTFEPSNSDPNSIEWRMNYSEPYTVYVSVDTTDGHRYLSYNSSDFDDLSQDYDEIGTEDYIHHGLGGETRNGQWHVINRNLLDDLQEAEPDNHIIATNSFYIRGSGLVDDLSSLPTTTGNH
jgi:hypothetical protein